MNEIEKLSIDVKEVRGDLIHILNCLYDQLVIKHKRIVKLEEQVARLSKRDVNKMDIQTKAEGISALRARFNHWMNKLIK